MVGWYGLPMELPIGIPSHEVLMAAGGALYHPTINYVPLEYIYIYI